jgi:uncharacterized repeat protein (TIGR03803 family)
MTEHKALNQILLLLALCAAVSAQAQKPKFKVLAQIDHHPHSYAGLVQGLNGELYSTTAGGNHNPGQVFEITADGHLKTLETLSGSSEAGLLLATDGNFYGTTLKAGEHNGGRIFRMTPSGQVTNLYAFCAEADCADGEFPLGPLIQGTDGNLYGTTARGGPGCTEYAFGCGTVFRITLGGEITTLYTFCLQAGCLDGEGPYGAIVQAGDGNFYGITTAGGAGRSGTIYRLTPSGNFTLLYTFCTQSGCPDGSSPEGGLAQGPDGALYGATVSYATVFKITLDGTFQVLAKLCPGPECSSAYAPPVPATDGDLYGMTAGAGKNHRGTIYRITTSGEPTRLYGFCSLQDCKDRGDPMGPIVQATDGILYGTTWGITGVSGGTVYKLSLGLAPFVSPLPAQAKIGKQIWILGTNLTGSTAVSSTARPPHPSPSTQLAPPSPQPFRRRHYRTYSSHARQQYRPIKQCDL